MAAAQSIAQDTFSPINHVPVFYGARHNAGHSATVFHPGGGEFANVASNWLRFIFKDDEGAGQLFTGTYCGLCTTPTWDTNSKGLSFSSVRSAATERIVMRHLAASEAGDASVVPRDYAEDAIVIFGGEATTGVDAVQQLFADLYSRTRLDLTYTARAFEDNVGYVAWTMGSLTGSDTFVVEDGKIAIQTGIVFSPAE